MVDLQDIKLPPHNIEAEKGVISSILIDNETMYILDGLNVLSQDFYKKEHQFIYEAIKTLWTAHKTVDVITLSDELTKNGKLEDIGGVDYLYDLSSFVMTATVASDYGKILKEKSTLRNILKASQDIIGDVYEEKETIETLDKIEKRIFDLTQVNLSDSLIHIRDVMEGRMEEYQEIAEDPGKLEREKVSSGYSNLDNMYGGFNPGDMVVLAARPSMGKTAFALNLVANAAKQNKSIAVFSLEMGSDQIVDRILSLTTEIPMYKIHKGELDEEDFSSIGDTMGTLAETNIFIDDKGGATISEMKSKLRRVKIEKGGLDMVIIDYLQLMSSNSNQYMGNRVQEISEISRGLKELARELKVPIIALSQLSRAVEQRPDKTPQLADLRESGAIEQDADSVFMLYREDYYDPDTDKKGIADVFIRKNRNGPVGECEFHFKKEIMKFYAKASEDMMEE